VPAPLSLIDHDTDGRRADVTPLFADAAAFREVVRQITSLARPTGFTLVAGIDALGFVLGAAVAIEAGTGFVPVRKGGKLPVETDSAAFDDYDGTRKTLEVRRGAFGAADRVLIVDEWIETGAQVLAAAMLIEGQGAAVAGAATIHCDDGGKAAVGGWFPVVALEWD
jgi:adenine phosphoribosyltransferase